MYYHLKSWGGETQWRWRPNRWTCSHRLSRDESEKVDRGLLVVEAEKIATVTFNTSKGNILIRLYNWRQDTRRLNDSLSGLAGLPGRFFHVLLLTRKVADINSHTFKYRRIILFKYKSWSTGKSNNNNVDDGSGSEGEEGFRGQSYVGGFLYVISE